MENETTPKVSRINQTWLTRSYPISEYIHNLYQTLKQANNTSPPDLILLTGAMLHAVTLSGREKEQQFWKILKDTNLIQQNSDSEIKMAKNLINKYLKNWARKFPNTTILYLSVEEIQEEHYVSDATRNQCIRSMNQKIDDWIPVYNFGNEADTLANSWPGNFRHMSVNLRVIFKYWQYYCNSGQCDPERGRELRTHAGGRGYGGGAPIKEKVFSCSNQL